MKLKGADLEHEQHEALVTHYQVKTLITLLWQALHLLISS